MGWTMTEGYGMPLGSSLAPGAPQEVFLVSFPLPLRACTRQPLSRRLPPASAHGALPLVKRLQALLALAQCPSISAVAERRSRGEPTVRASRHPSLFQGRASWVDQAAPGRPSPRTNTHRPPRAAWRKARSQAAGDPAGGWTTPRLQALRPRPCGVASPPPLARRDSSLVLLR